MKGQNTGVENEKNILRVYNNVLFKDLTFNQQKIIKVMDKNILDENIISTKGVGGLGLKPDVQFIIRNKRYYVSVKTGKNNSVHQEKNIDFIKYCKNFLDMNDYEEQCLLLYLYGDGTIDGNSDREARLSSLEVTEKYAQEKKVIQSFFNRNKRSLLERFIKYGRLGRQKNIYADFIYHGNTENGVICLLDDLAIDYLMECSKESKKSITIGPLTLQAWNRNPNADPKRESRRHSIQIKWDSCKSDIENINIYQQKNYNQKSENRIGDNSSGFKNQINIALCIDNQRVNKLRGSLKNLVLTVFPNIAMSENVLAKPIKGNTNKARVQLIANNDSKNIAISKGKGISIHQENIKYFLPYCQKKLGMTNNEKESFLKVLYGDGTIDGSADPHLRMNDDEIKKQLHEDVVVVKNFLNRNKRILIERFLIKGRTAKQEVLVDGIYYGTSTAGWTANIENVLEFLYNTEDDNNALLPIGHLRLQTWNRNLKNKPGKDYKRSSIQIKWPNMKEDIKIISSNNNNLSCFDGFGEEYELVYALNKNKSSNFWSVLKRELKIKDNENYYAIRVSYPVFSDLSKREVLAKSDLYLVNGVLPKNVLIDNNYWLDESLVRDFNLNVISNSGISCKNPHSKSYTYCKLSVNSFYALFNCYNLGAGISLFANEKDIKYNEGVINAWKIKPEDFYEFFSDYINIPEENPLMNLEFCKSVKKISNELIKEKINNDNNIANAIFFGKGVFKEPYCSSFIYEKGEMKVNFIPSFTITTGSGRHKGIYTVVIKP